MIGLETLKATVGRRHCVSAIACLWALAEYLAQQQHEKTDLADPHKYVYKEGLSGADFKIANSLRMFGESPEGGSGWYPGWLRKK